MKKYKIITYILTSLLAATMFLSPFVEFCVGRCLDNDGNGKEYNGEPYYNYIHYPETVSENDIVLTMFILDTNGEYAERVFDKVILKDTK